MVKRGRIRGGALYGPLCTCRSLSCITHCAHAGLLVLLLPPPSPRLLICIDIVDMQAAGVAGVGSGACAIASVACP